MQLPLANETNNKLISLLSTKKKRTIVKSKHRRLLRRRLD